MPLSAAQKETIATLLKYEVNFSEEEALKKNFSEYIDLMNVLVTKAEPSAAQRAAFGNLFSYFNNPNIILRLDQLGDHNAIITFGDIRENILDLLDELVQEYAEHHKIDPAVLAASWNIATIKARAFALPDNNTPFTVSARPAAAAAVEPAVVLPEPAPAVIIRDLAEFRRMLEISRAQELAAEQADAAALAEVKRASELAFAQEAERKLAADQAEATRLQLILAESRAQQDQEEAAKLELIRRNSELDFAREREIKMAVARATELELQRALEESARQYAAESIDQDLEAAIRESVKYQAADRRGAEQRDSEMKYAANGAPVPAGVVPGGHDAELHTALEESRLFAELKINTEEQMAILAQFSRSQQRSAPSAPSLQQLAAMPVARPAAAAPSAPPVEQLDALSYLDEIDAEIAAADARARRSAPAAKR